MSHSPLTGSGDPAATELEAYEAGWFNVSRWIRAGKSWSGHERDAAFLNLGGWREGRGRYADVSHITGLDLEQDGRAAVPVDWDWDGDQDLWVTARTSPRVRLLVNQRAPDKNFLAVRLHGTQANRDAVGARVELRLRGGVAPVLVRSRRAGQGYLAQSSAWLHFGLGKGEIEDLTVHWPGGGRESFGAPARGSFVQLVQGSGVARSWAPPSVPDAAEPTPVAEGPAQVSEGVRLPLAIPVPMPQLEVTDLENVPGKFLGITPGGGRGPGRPLLITLWSHTCAPCLGELSALARAGAAFAEVGLESVLLSVDPPSESEQVLAVLERTGAPGRRGFARTSCLEVLDAMASIAGDRPSRLGVPASFLVDPQGRLQVIYLGPVRPAVVLADLMLLGLDPQQRRMGALPYPGLFLRAAPQGDLAWWEGAMRRRGLKQVGLQFAMGQVEAGLVDEAELHAGFGQARLQQGKLAEARTHFERATELNPYVGEAWAGLGQTLRRLGELEEAERALRKGVGMVSDDGRVHLELGRVLVARGDADGVAAQIRLLTPISSDLAAELTQLWQAAQASRDARPDRDRQAP